jgi:hypothetical protein
MKGKCAALENSRPHPASAAASQPLNIRRNWPMGRERGTEDDRPQIDPGGSSRNRDGVLRMRWPVVLAAAGLTNESLFNPEQHKLLHALLVITMSLNARLSSATICISGHATQQSRDPTACKCVVCKETCTSAMARSMPSGPILLMLDVGPTHLEHPHVKRRICTENAHPLHNSRQVSDHCVTGAESIVHPVPELKNSNDDLDGRHGYARQCIRNCVDAAANILVCAAVKSAKSNETGANRGERTVVALHDVVNVQGEG